MEVGSEAVSKTELTTESRKLKTQKQNWFDHQFVPVNFDFLEKVFEYRQSAWKYVPDRFGYRQLVHQDLVSVIFIVTESLIRTQHIDEPIAYSKIGPDCISQYSGGTLMLSEGTKYS